MARPSEGYYKKMDAAVRKGTQRERDFDAATKGKGRWVTVKGHAVFIADTPKGTVVARPSGTTWKNPAAGNLYASTKLGTGQWISQGTYQDLDKAQARIDAWVEHAGSDGSGKVVDSIGNTVYHNP